jgi:hypothetical protein
VSALKWLVRFVPSFVLAVLGAVGLVLMLWESLRPTPDDPQWRWHHRWDTKSWVDYVTWGGIFLAMLICGAQGLWSALCRRPPTC